MRVSIRLLLLIIMLAASLPGLAQNDVVAPNENLVVEVVPPVPASLAEGVERYSNFRGAALTSWDPT